MNHGTMDPLFQAISLFRRREFEGCADKCTEILAGHPYDQVSRAANIPAARRIYVLITCVMCNIDSGAASGGESGKTSHHSPITGPCFSPKL